MFILVRHITFLYILALMSYIANIVTKGKISLDMGDTINVCRSMEEAVPSIPTLIVGYRTAKKVIVGFNMADKDYPSQGMYWTFSKNERKSDYDVDILRFCDMAVRKITDSIEYHYINPYQTGYNEIKDILQFIKSGEDKLMMFDENHNNLFIYRHKRNMIYGISIGSCEYAGVSRDKIAKRIADSGNIVLKLKDISLPIRIKRLLSNKKYDFLVLYDYLKYNNDYLL